MILAIVDAGPLVAALDSTDPRHAQCMDLLDRRDLRLVLPALAVAEALYYAGDRLGADAEAALLRSLYELDVEAPAPADWLRMADLVEQYADFPLGGTDASVIALAERLDASVIITLDRRHFGAVRPAHRDAFQLLP